MLDARVWEGYLNAIQEVLVKRLPVAEFRMVFVDPTACSTKGDT